MSLQLRQTSPCAPQTSQASVSGRGRASSCGLVGRSGRAGRGSSL